MGGGQRRYKSGTKFAASSASAALLHRASTGVLVSASHAAPRSLPFLLGQKTSRCFTPPLHSLQVGSTSASRPCHVFINRAAVPLILRPWLSWYIPLVPEFFVFHAGRHEVHADTPSRRKHFLTESKNHTSPLTNLAILQRHTQQQSRQLCTGFDGTAKFLAARTDGKVHSLSQSTSERALSVMLQSK